MNEKLNLSEYNITTIVSFETVEHTPNPFAVVQKFYNILPVGGRLILSFPNYKNEMIDENGKSMDPYHLSVINFDDMIKHLEKLGFKINRILGQSLINNIIAQVLKIEEDLNISFESLYNYKKGNILTQSRNMAYPNDANVEKSYSYILDLIK